MTPLQKRLRWKYTASRFKVPYLRVGNQWFRVGYECYTAKERAWMRDRLAEALVLLLDSSSDPSVLLYTRCRDAYSEARKKAHKAIFAIDGVKEGK